MVQFNEIPESREWANNKKDMSLADLLASSTINNFHCYRFLFICRHFYRNENVYYLMLWCIPSKCSHKKILGQRSVCQHVCEHSACSSWRLNMCYLAPQKKVNRLHSWCCRSSRKFLIILNYSWFLVASLNVKCHIISSWALQGSAVVRLGLDCWTVWWVSFTFCPKLTSFAWE